MMPLREEDKADAPHGPPCAFQACDGPATAFPVVQLPPPAVARNGQPLRVVLRRSPVCDAHRRQMALQLRLRLEEAVSGYLARRALPLPDWDQVSWEWEPLEET